MKEFDHTASGGVNFLPEDYVEQRVQGRWNIICIGLIVTVFVGVVAGVVVQQKSLAQAADERDKINEEYVKAGKAVEQVNELTEKGSEMMTKFQVSSSLLEPVPRSKLLEQLTLMLPKGVDLLGVDLKTKVLPGQPQTRLQDAQAKLDADGKTIAQPPPPPPQREVTVIVAGQAVTDAQVAAFISNLSHNPVATDVNLVYSEEYKNKDEVLRRFSIEMKLAEALDLKALAENVSKTIPAAN